MNNITRIFGAPGCGKTTKLLEILEHELKETAPDRIAFVSFTRKGSYEGRDRVIDKLGYDEKELPYFRTLHSIVFRDGGYSIYDMVSKKDYKSFSKAMGMNFTGYYTEEFYNNDDKYLFLYFLQKNNIETFKTYENTLNERVYMNVAKNYDRYKYEYAHIVDFTDIIEIFIKKNKPLPVDVAVIDEAQDLTTLQWKACEVAFRDCKRVYVAGDDDQAIYQWNGADIRYFLGLQANKDIILDKSYRLKENILQFSKAISKNISYRIDKNFLPVNVGGEVHFHNSLESVPLKNNESYYFLSRNNCFLKKYKEFLMTKGAVFQYKDESSVDLKEIVAIKTYEKVRQTHQMTEEDEAKFKGYLKDGFSLIHPWYIAFDMDADKIAYYKDLFANDRTDFGSKKYLINTIHGVKGGEADNVVLLLDITRSVQQNIDVNTDAELRCLYVACTRAKNNLHIVYSDKVGYENYFNIKESKVK